MVKKLMPEEPYAPGLIKELEQRYSHLGQISFGVPTIRPQTSRVTPQFNFDAYDYEVFAGQTNIGIYSLHVRSDQIIAKTFTVNSQTPFYVSREIVVEETDKKTGVPKRVKKHVQHSLEPPFLVWSPYRGREDPYAREVKFLEDVED